MKDKKRSVILNITYIYTLVGAGGFGIVMFLAPEFILNRFPFLQSEVIPFGTLACLWTAFGIVAGLALLKPYRFIPILFIQLLYKSLWFVFVIFPLAIQGDLPYQVVTFIVVYASFIVLDLIVIPFKEIFNRETVKEEIAALN